MNIFTLYYLVATVLMLVMLWNYRQDLLALLLILLAFSGTIAYWIPLGMQIINIVTVLLSTYLAIEKKLWTTFSCFRYLIASFTMFSLYFVLNNLLNHGESVLMIFSQYSKYYVPFVCLLLFLYYAIKNALYLRYFNQLIGIILIIQACISVYKFWIFGGNFFEGMVGTFGALRGGGIGTSFPLVALCWVAINSNMDIRKWKSWLFIACLLLLGIATGKRAVILLFPILFMVLSVYVCKKKYSNRIWMIVAVAPLLFYLGVRLTPTFNPENKVWGSFDLEYMMNYTKEYSTGHVEEGEEYKGRLGSAFSFWNILKDIDNYSNKILLGEGVGRAYSSIEERKDYNQFGQDYNLNSRGDITGVLMLYIAIGIVGVILLIIYYVFLFRIVRYKRLRWVLFLLVMFDFIFYNSTMIRNPFISTLMMFVIVYSLVQYSPRGRYLMNTHPMFAPRYT